MLKRKIILGGIFLLAFTACSSRQESDVPPVASTPVESQTPTAMSENEVWYEKLITDSEYSLEDALKDYPEKERNFDGEVILDNLHTGNLSQQFDITVIEGNSLRLTMICDSDGYWKSTLSPLHEEFFAEGNSCSGVSRFETKPLDEKLSRLYLNIEPEDEDMVYRVILEVKGDN